MLSFNLEFGNHLAMILVPPGNHLGIVWQSFGNRLKIILVSFGNQFGIICGSPGNHLGIGLTSFWIVWKSMFHHVGIILA